MKELGRLKYFLDIEVAYSALDIFISQQKYVMSLSMETEKADVNMHQRQWIHIKN